MPITKEADTATTLPASSFNFQIQASETQDEVVSQRPEKAAKLARITLTHHRPFLRLFPPLLNSWLFNLSIHLTRGSVPFLFPNLMVEY